MSKEKVYNFISYHFMWWLIVIATWMYDIYNFISYSINPPKEKEDNS